MPSAFGTCPKCGVAYPTGSAFCARCGHSLVEGQPQPVVCGVCGNSYSPNDAFCTSCGQSLSRQFNANTASPPALAIKQKQKRSIWRQIESGIGLLLMIGGIFAILAVLKEAMTHPMTSASLLANLISMALGIFLGFALVQNGRGKSVK